MPAELMENDGLRAAGKGSGTCLLLDRISFGSAGEKWPVAMSESGCHQVSPRRIRTTATYPQVSPSVDITERIASEIWAQRGCYQPFESGQDDI